MSNLMGADAYFAQTMRNEKWQMLDESKRTAAIAEAGNILSHLPYRRYSHPPISNMDNAVYEQAYWMLMQSEEDEERNKAVATGLVSRSVGNASESYLSSKEQKNAPGWYDGIYISPKALLWIQQYLAPTNAPKLGRLVCR